MITFARTRWNYESYTDFWKLVELSGYPVCYVDEMNLEDSANLYITTPMNGELKPFIDGYKTSHGDVKSQLLLWNIERPSGSNGLENYITGHRELIAQGYLSDVIVSDFMLSRQTGFAFVPMGSHEGLGQPGALADKKYDLIHLCCYSNKRGWMFDDPSRPKTLLYGASVATNGWGVERHNRLQASRFMLNIHQDNYQYIEPQRFALAAAYGLPVITEYVQSSGLDKYCIIVNNKDYHEAINLGKTMYEAHYYELGLAFREMMTQHMPFKKMLEGAL